MQNIYSSLEDDGFVQNNSAKKPKISKKYPFLKELEKDSNLYVNVPENTKYEEIVELFSKYGTFKIPMPKNPFTFTIFFNDNPAAANKAKNELQYKKVKNGFIVILKLTERNYTDISARIIVTTDRKLDPSKLHSHFESNSQKVSYVNKTRNGFLVQYYTREDRDEAFNALKTLSFEGFKLRIEIGKDELTNIKKPVASSSISKGSSEHGKEEKSEKEENNTDDDESSGSEEEGWEFKPKGTVPKKEETDSIVEKKGNQAEKKESSVSASIKSGIQESKSPLSANINSNVEQSKSPSSASIKSNIEESKPDLPKPQPDNMKKEDPNAAIKKEKIINKLEKQLSEFVKNDMVLKILVQRLKKFDNETLTDFLIDDDWPIQFFKIIAQV